MARPREFDERHAVESAMHAFWRSGYEGTSTQELCAATGLGRSSIYNTFNSKYALFRKALDHYCASRTQGHLDILEAPGGAREKLRTLLHRVVEDELTHDHRGCLAVNTVAELGGRDTDVTTALRADAERIIDAIRVTVEAGQRAGEIDKHKDAQALAEFVHSQIGGLRLLSRGGADRKSLQNVTEVALSAL